MTQPPNDTVNFSYAFATPHRITLCRPESGYKTLMDVEAAKVRMSWSTEMLSDINTYIWKAPRVDWCVDVMPLIDHAPYPCSDWERDTEGIPCLVNRYWDDDVHCTLVAVGAASGMLIKVVLENKGDRAHSCSILCEHKGGWIISNPAWIDGGHPNTLMAMQQDRPDRLLVVGMGADHYPVKSELTKKDGLTVPMFGSVTKEQPIRWEKSTVMLWNLEPGHVKTGWILRPYDAYEEDIPRLMQHDWQREFDETREEWLDLLRLASPVSIPDPGVQKAFRACLSDLFVMREVLKGGEMAGVPGTEVYRAPNAYEPCIAAVLLDQLGLHAHAAAGLNVMLGSQEEDGNWTDPHGWGHHMWGASGYKAWAVMEHYRLTQDVRFLQLMYPRMVASSRWQEKQREKTRITGIAPRSPEWGLMPRGMGDAGLMNGDDYFGVFYPHNFLAVYADRLSVEAAEILGKVNDLPELRLIYNTALIDLKASLEAGAITEKEYRWIPGTPNKTSGSRWGALLSFAPCGILAGDDPLVCGTLAHIERSISSGGIPVGTGWMSSGLWVAIALDNIAQAHLALGNGDAACRYLYPTLNHASPLITWCEERESEAGTNVTSGDLQHLWTPLAVCRYIRDAMLLERDDGLELASGTPRNWLVSGNPLGIADAPTHFGAVSYSLQYCSATDKVTGTVRFPENGALKQAALHIRLPHGYRVVSLLSGAAPDDSISLNGDCIQWNQPHGVYQIEVLTSCY